MAEKLFPIRKRCKACGHGLGTSSQTSRTKDKHRRPLVVRGLYCSYRCASMAEPGTDITTAPRSCKTQRDGAWAWKNAYRSIEEIPAPIRAEKSSSHYWCDVCGLLHIGHQRVDLAKEATRRLDDPADLCDMLVKMRGNATHRQIADALNDRGMKPKVNGARIKEAEDPSHDTGMRVVIALLNLYRSRLVVLLPTSR